MKALKHSPPKVVLAKPAGGVTHGFEQLREGRIFLTHTEVGARHTHLAEAGTKNALAGDEGGPPGRAALLGVVIGKDHAFFGDGIDVWRREAHQAVPAQTYVAKFLGTFEEFPPRQKAASFTIDQIIKQMEDAWSAN